MIVLRDIKKELKQNADFEYKKGSINFYKEKVDLIGVRSAVTRKIAAKYFKEIKHLSKEVIFDLCEGLLNMRILEGDTIAFDWAYRSQKQFSASDFIRFEKWLKKYVSNWSSCDDFCTHAFGCLVLQFPELIPKVKKWAVSKNVWVRRASAVVFIHALKRKKYLDESFWVADKLLTDPEDMAQKGYGWMLKEAANHYQKEVFDFVMKRKNKMPRTALRYAIEKMPATMKEKAMAR